MGRTGPLDALEEIAAHTGGSATWRAALDRLVDWEIFELIGNRWSFRSDLVREVAYSTLTKTERARRHAEIAQWMEQRLPGDGVDDAVVDRMAFHYGVAASLAQELGLVAGLPGDLVERALQWLGEAGRRAQGAEVHVLAAQLFGQALRLAGPEPTAQRLVFLLGRAEAHWGLYELEAAALDVEEALEVAGVLERPPRSGQGPARPGRGRTAARGADRLRSPRWRRPSRSSASWATAAARRRRCASSA